MRRLLRPTLSAAVFVGLLAFWAGLWMAARKYPAEYDWRYMTISGLLYPDRNPDGYRWAWAGVMLCALGGLSWTTGMLRDSRSGSAGGRAVGIWALGLGYLCMLSCAWLPRWFPWVPRGHDLLALLSFVGIALGIVGLTFQVAGRSLGRRASPGGPRLAAWLLAGAALSPILLAAITQLYVSYALPDLPWVGLVWRARGAPVYLSFAFWEWAACVIFSVYTLGLCVATTRAAASAGSARRGPATPSDPHVPPHA